MSKDFKLGAYLFAFCLFLWFYAIPFQVKGSEQSLFPYFVTIFIFIPSVILLMRGYKQNRTKNSGKNGTPREVMLRSMAMVLGMLAYVFFIDILGYFTTTFLAVVGFLLFFGIRKPLPLLLVPAGICLVVQVVIGVILSFPLPEGILF